eukprot:UN02814
MTSEDESASSDDSKNAHSGECDEWEIQTKQMDCEPFWIIETNQKSVILEHDEIARIMDDDMDDMGSPVPTRCNQVLLCESVTEVTPDPQPVFEPGLPSPLSIQHKKKKMKNKNDKHELKYVKTTFKNRPRKYKPKRRSRAKHVRKKTT